MEKKISYEKIVKWIIIAISLFAVFIHIGNYTIFTLPSIMFYAWHLMIGMVLIFLYYPLGRKRENKSKGFIIACRIIDWILIALALLIGFYVVLNFDAYSQMMQNNQLTQEMFVLGIIVTLLTLESGRRVLGNVLPIIAIIAILYAYFGDKIPGLFGHRGYNTQRITLSIFSDRAYTVLLSEPRQQMYICFYCLQLTWLCLVQIRFSRILLLQQQGAREAVRRRWQ